MAAINRSSHEGREDDREEGEISDEEDEIFMRIKEFETTNAELEQLERITAYTGDGYDYAYRGKSKQQPNDLPCKIVISDLSSISSEELVQPTKRHQRTSAKAKRKRKREHYCSHRRNRQRNADLENYPLAMPPPAAARGHCEVHVIRDDSDDDPGFALNREKLRLALAHNTSRTDGSAAASLQRRLQPERYPTTNVNRKMRSDAPSRQQLVLGDEDEEQELRMIALKSAMIRKHLARKKRNAEAAYSPTDFDAMLASHADPAEELPVCMELSPTSSVQTVLSLRDEDDLSNGMSLSMSAVASPAALADHRPIDMDIASSDSDVEIIMCGNAPAVAPALVSFGSDCFSFRPAMLGPAAAPPPHSSTNGYENALPRPAGGVCYNMPFYEMKTEPESTPPFVTASTQSPKRDRLESHGDHSDEEEEEALRALLLSKRPARFLSSQRPNGAVSSAGNVIAPLEARSDKPIAQTELILKKAVQRLTHVVVIQSEETVLAAEKHTTNSTVASEENQPLMDGPNGLIHSSALENCSSLNSDVENAQTNGHDDELQLQELQQPQPQHRQPSAPCDARVLNERQAMTVHKTPNQLNNNKNNCKDNKKVQMLKRRNSVKAKPARSRTTSATTIAIRTPHKTNATVTVAQPDNTTLTLADDMNTHALAEQPATKAAAPPLKTTPSATLQRKAAAPKVAPQRKAAPQQKAASASAKIAVKSKPKVAATTAIKTVKPVPKQPSSAATSKVANAAALPATVMRSQAAASLGGRLSYSPPCRSPVSVTGRASPASTGSATRLITSVNLPELQVKKLIIRLTASDAEDDYCPLAVLKPPVINSIAAKPTMKNFEHQIDTFLKNMRSKNAPASAASDSKAQVNQSALALPAVDADADKTVNFITPQAVKHLPPAAQEEYLRLVNRMNLLQQRKQPQPLDKSSAASLEQPQEVVNGVTATTQVNAQQTLNEYEQSLRKISLRIIGHLDKSLSLVEEARNAKIAKLCSEKRLKRLRAELEDEQCRFKAEQQKILNISPMIVEANEAIGALKQKRARLLTASEDLAKSVAGIAIFRWTNEHKQEISAKTKTLSTNIKNVNSIKLKSLEEFEAARLKVTTASTLAAVNGTSTSDAAAVVQPPTPLKVTAQPPENNADDAPLDRVEKRLEEKAASVPLACAQSFEDVTTAAGTTTANTGQTQPKGTTQVSPSPASPKCNELAEPTQPTLEQQQRQESDVPSHEEPPAKALRAYKSPLQRLSQRQSQLNGNGVVCPYALMGQCKDADCAYTHLAGSDTI